ncbi:MAG: HEAT repeat domain-containing protein [Anaerolineae bacterium]|nr:HEAT repeat domain-containing protein [Anaerolineae bacterium]
MSDDKLPAPANGTSIKHYSELRESSFFTWFNLTEIEKKPNPYTQGQWVVALKPGGHTEHIDIFVLLDEQEHIHNGTLNLRRAWMTMGTGLNPLAIDISQSFIASMILTDEAAAAQPVIDAIWAALRSNPGMPMLVRSNPDEQPVPPPTPAVTDFIDTYLGKRRQAEITLPRSLLSAHSEPPGFFGKPDHDLRFTLTVRLPDDPSRHAPRPSLPTAKLSIFGRPSTPALNSSDKQPSRRADPPSPNLSKSAPPPRLVPPQPADEPASFHYISLGLPGFSKSTIKWDRRTKRLIYTHIDDRDGVPPEEKVFQPSAYQWRSFWKLMDSLRAWKWQMLYRKFVFDGHHWSLDIEHGDKQLSSSGENDYPPGWELFRKAINGLVGGSLGGSSYALADPLGLDEDLFEAASLSATVHDGPESALPNLIQALDGYQWKSAARALAKFRLEALPAMPSLLQHAHEARMIFADDPMNEVLSAIASGAENGSEQRVRELGLPVLSSLLEVLLERTFSASVRHELFRVVNHMGLSDDEFMPVLMACVQDAHQEGQRLCRSAYYAFRDRDSRPPEMVSILLTALQQRVYEQYGFAEELVDILKLYGDEPLRQAVAILLPAINHASHDVRYKAAGGLGIAGELAASAVPFLLAAFQDTKDRHRWIYASTLGKIGAEAEAAVPALVEALTDKGVASTDHVATALGQIGRRPEIVIPALLATLTTSSHQTCGKIASALVKFGAANLSVLPALIDIVQTSPSNVRQAAMKVIASLGADAHDSLPALIEVLEHDIDRWTRCEAAETIGAVGAAAPEAILALKQACHDDSLFVREHAAKALSLVDMASALPTLIALVRQSEEKIARDDTIFALGHYGAQAAPAVPALLEALKAQDSHTRHLAVNALGNIGFAAQEALTALIDFNDPDGSIMIAAATAVRKIDPQRTSYAIGVYVRMLHSAERVTRAYALHALEEVGAVAQSALDEVIAATHDGEGYVRRAALAALKAIQADSSA